MYCEVFLLFLGVTKMSKYQKLTFPIILLSSVFFVNANATLINHGDGLIYDDELDITWLSDSNLAGNAMNWADALGWAADLEYAGALDWRLPSAIDKDGSGLLPTSSLQAYDPGIKGDLKHLFLDLGGVFDPDGSRTADYGNFNANADLFSNVVFSLGRDDVYWTSEQGSMSDRAYYFAFSNGGQWQKRKDGSMNHGLGFAWAVHDGKLGMPVSEPVSILLLGSGLLSFAVIRRRKNGVTLKYK